MPSRPLRSPVTPPPIIIVPLRRGRSFLPTSFQMAKIIKNMQSMTVIGFLGAEAKPKAPKAVKGTARMRKYPTAFQSIDFQPISTLLRLLSSWAIVLTGTATSTP